MVLRLEIIAVFIAVEVRYGAYIARLRLHKNAAAPFRMFLCGLGPQSVLHDILQVGVDGGHDIESVFRLFDGHGLVPTADTLDATHAVHAAQFFVKTLLQPRVADAVFAVDTTDGPAGQYAVGLDAAVLVLKEDTAPVFAFFDQRVLLQLAPLQVVDPMVAYFESFLATPVGLHDAVLVFRRGLTAYDGGQVFAQRVDMGRKERAVLLVQRGYARIHINIILRHTAGEESTVTVENVTARGFDRLECRYLPFGYFEPFGSLYSLNVNDFRQHGYKAKGDDDEDDGEAPHRVSLFVTHNS